MPTSRSLGFATGLGCRRFVLAASIGAVFDVSPVLFPAFSPGHLTTAGCTCFAGQRCFIAFESQSSAQGVVVVVGVSAVVTAPQLHGHIFVGVGDPFNAEEWRAALYF